MMGRIIEKIKKRNNCVALAILIFQLLYSLSHAQTLIDPITGSTTSYGQVNSDYGPRHVTNGSNPHIGIDYQLSEGGKAYAVEGGNIELIQKYYTSSKIKIGNWRYIHMMNGASPDKTWEFRQTDVDEYPYSTWLIYLRSYQNGVLQTDRVLCEQGISGYHFDKETNQTVQLESTVTAGDWIFTSNGENHLHLDYSPGNNDGWENPFRYVAHRDDYNPTVHLNLQHQNGGQAAFFTDSAVYGNPLIIMPMQNVTIDKDFNEMRISIIDRNQQESLLKTYNYEHYGLAGIPIHVLVNGPAILNDDRHGIYPFSPLPSQDYFKHHFNSRMDAQGNPAANNLEAVYPDGRYTFRARGTDITNNDAIQDKKAILDNFRPFIRGISISSDHLLYSAHGQWDAGQNQFYWTVNQQSTYASGLIDVSISVQLSEPMRYLTVDFDNSSILSAMPNKNMQACNPEQTEWSIRIPYIYLYQAINSGFQGFQHLVFEGEDLAGSALFKPEFPGNTAGYQFPHRNNNGSWSTGNKSGSDNNHGIYLGNGAIPSVLNAAFAGMPLFGSTPLQVIFTDVSSGSVQQWEWNFGNGFVWHGQHPPAITYINNTSQPKTYSVSLKVTDNSGNTDTEYKINHVTVLPQGSAPFLQASFSFDQHDLGVPSLVDFVNTSSGNGISCSWDFDDGTTSQAYSPSHVFTSPGYYDVRLEITDLAGNKDDIEQTIYVYPQIPSWLSVDFTCPQPAIAGDFTQFTDLTTGGPSFAKKFWDFGDGNMTEVLGTPIHLYYSPGTYQVRLEVRDYLDNILGVRSKQISVIPFALNDLSTDENQLKAKDVFWGDMNGRAVAINGNWACVGSPYDDDDGKSSGSVYVYRLGADSTWTQFQKIKANVLTAEDYFGSTIACQGNWLMVGAPGNSTYTNGKAVAFYYNGTEWEEKQTLHCPSSSIFHFGWAMDMDADVCCISAPNNSKLTPGAAYVYRLNNGQWHNEACLSDASGSGQDRFGMDVAVSDGHIATSIHKSAGADKLWFWVRNGKNWVKNSTLSVQDAGAVDIDCPYAVLGDKWNNRLGVYEYRNGQWVFDSHIYPEDGAIGTDDFGRDVAINGRYILAGKPGDDNLEPQGGSAYLFRRDNYGNWVQRKKLTPSTPESDEHFGFQVDLSPNHVICGAYGWKGNRGSAYVYNNITETCDRIHHWCNFSLYPTESLNEEAGYLQMAGDGCSLAYYSGSRATHYAREHALLPGFTAHEGCEAIFSSMDCSLAGYLLKSGCSCISPSPEMSISDEGCKLIVWPNPGLSSPKVNWNSSQDEALIRVSSVNGNIVLPWNSQEKGSSLELSGYSPGTYLIEAILNGQSCSTRWVKLAD